MWNSDSGRIYTTDRLETLKTQHKFKISHLNLLAKQMESVIRVKTNRNSRL